MKLLQITFATFVIMMVIMPEDSEGQITIDTNTALLGALVTVGAIKAGYYYGASQNRQNLPFRRSRYYHRHRPRWGRRRRDVENEILITDEFLQMLEKVLIADKNECTLLLTCHVASLDPESLTPEMISLLLPFLGEVENNGNAYSRFAQAVVTGETDGASCKQEYSACPNKSKDLLKNYLKTVRANAKQPSQQE